jgi:GT2 family glycosyltransferase
VVTWNGRRFLDRCLASLMRSFELVSGVCEVLVVDNGSADGSSDFVAANFPEARLLRNDTNIGFAAATTNALTHATGAFIALLNDDTEVDPSWLVEMLVVMLAHPTAGSCAPQVRFLHHPTRINSAGIVVDRAGIAADRLGGEPIARSEGTPVEVFGPSGSAVLFRRSMLDEIGLYEPRFFAYLEDVDHAWRAKRAGWRCLYVPGAIVYHVHSGTSGQGSPRKAFLLNRNQVWVLARNASLAQMMRYGPWIVVRLLGVSAFYLVTRRSVAPIIGTVAGVRGIPGIIHGRRRYPFLRAESFAPVRSPIRQLRLRLQRDDLAR